LALAAAPAVFALTVFALIAASIMVLAAASALALRAASALALLAASALTEGFFDLDEVVEGMSESSRGSF